MDYIVLIAYGFAFGLFAAVPIGPVNLLCIRRTLELGPLYGFVSGLGATCGDMLFAIALGFGLTAVKQFIAGFSFPLQLIGGLLLVSIGVRTYFAKPVSKLEVRVAANENGKRPATFASSMASTFALTISNPAAPILFVGVFSLLSGRLGNNPSFIATSVVLIGVLAGSVTWWATLATGVGLLHARFTDNVVRTINKVSGFAIACFGIAILGHLVFGRLF